MPAAPPPVPRLTYLRIKNYRSLRDVEFRDLTPLTVLIGPNGSGKSTVLDALDFLAEAVRGNLVQAWEKRDRFRGMRTRGQEGGIEFEVKIGPFLTGYFLSYFLIVNEIDDEIARYSEQLSIKNGKANYHLMFSEKNENGQSMLILDDGILGPDGDISLNKRRIINDLTYIIIPSYTNTSLPNLRFSYHSVRPFAIEIINFIDNYRLLHLTDDHLKGYSDAGPREKLSPTGDNLPNVLYYLHEKHPEVLEKITAQLRRWVPQLANVVPEITSDERLLLRFKDAAFEKPLPAQYMSGGTMRLAALLTLLYEPGATGLLGIEEPENELHPHLLPYLAEELIAAAEHRQLLVATHAPGLLNALEPAQVWILHRGPDGYTQATRAADLPGIPAMVAEGSPLGYLWARNFFDVGSPLASPQPTE